MRNSPSRPTSKKHSLHSRCLALCDAFSSKCFRITTPSLKYGGRLENNDDACVSMYCIIGWCGGGARDDVGDPQRELSDVALELVADEKDPRRGDFIDGVMDRL